MQKRRMLFIAVEQGTLEISAQSRVSLVETTKRTQVGRVIYSFWISCVTTYVHLCEFPEVMSYVECYVKPGRPNR